MLAPVQTIEQKRIIVALTPVLEQRYNNLRLLIDECAERDVEGFDIALAIADVESALNIMFPQDEQHDAEGF